MRWVRVLCVVWFGALGVVCQTGYATDATLTTGVTGVTPPPITASLIESLRKAAEDGDAAAQFNLGVCYFHGKGMAQDQHEAVKWFRKAAEQGNADAQFSLGVCYYKGSGLERNKEEATKWLRKAAEQGNGRAQKALDQMARTGQLAIVFWESVVMVISSVGLLVRGLMKKRRAQRKAAVEGDALVAAAQFFSGSPFDRARSVEQDKRDAARWYRSGAEQGDAAAQCGLGLCYVKGMGVEPDKEMAIRWLRKAAEQGHAEAAKALGDLEQLR